MGSNMKNYDAILLVKNSHIKKDLYYLLLAPGDEFTLLFMMYLGTINLVMVTR
jgi:hypothetical protein